MKTRSPKFHSIATIGMLILLFAGMTSCKKDVVEPVILSESTENENIDVNTGGIRTTFQFPVTGTGWYHKGGSTGHAPSAGYSYADDTYALDLNLSNNSDAGKSVYSIGDGGTVKQVNTAYGWVLIEYNYSITWKGKSYTKLYAGYLHMTNISVAVGNSVNKTTQIGKVGMESAESHHLHFAFYVGDLISGSKPNAKLLSINPSTIGSPFTNFNYGTNIRDDFADDYINYTGNVFTKNSSSDWHGISTHGFWSHMYYNMGSSNEVDYGKWKFNTITPVSAYDWKIWVYIPSNYASATNAKYIVKNGSTVTKTTYLNQSPVADKWLSISTIYLQSGTTTEVYLGDGGNSGAYVGYDIVRRWRKVDLNLYQ